MRDTHMSRSASESEAVTFGEALIRGLLKVGLSQTEFVSGEHISDCDVFCPIAGVV